MKREVADDLRRRCHLGDTPEDPVGRRVHVLDQLEVVGKAESDRLLAQVRQLSPGNLVTIDPACRARQAGLERRVQVTHGLPVGLEVRDRVEVEPRVAVGVRERGDQ